MIFEQAFRRKIMQGTKRRHTVPREGEREPYKLGQTVPAQTLSISEPRPGRHSLGEQRKPKRVREYVTFERLHIAGFGCTFLHALEPQDAQAEGHRDLAAMLAWWWSRYRTGPGIPGNPEYPVEIPVWVVYFELERVPQAHMLADTRRGKGDYTTGDGIGGGIVVPTEQLNPSWKEDAEARHREAQEAKARRRRLAEELRSTTAQADRASVDCSAEIASIEDSLAAIKQKVRGADDVAA